MSACRIRPIPLLESVLDKSLMTYRLNIGQSQRSIAYAWLIEGAGETILVDAGASAQYLSEVRGIRATEIQTLRAGLAKLGLGPEDVDLVLFTHLHNDHVAEARTLTRAKFLVQRAELAFAENPHPAGAVGYEREFLEGLRFECLEGDARICDEVTVLLTPGHTPGGQSVRVRTAEGDAIISGLCTIRETFDPPPGLARRTPVLTPGMHVDALEAYDSVLRVKGLADLVLPNHDPEHLGKDSIP